MIALLTPSASLASIMLIIGGALAITSGRNLWAAPPHYTKTATELPRAIQWLGLALGLALVAGAFVMAYEVLRLILQAAPAGG